MGLFIHYVTVLGTSTLLKAKYGHGIHTKPQSDTAVHQGLSYVFSSDVWTVVGIKLASAEFEKWMSIGSGQTLRARCSSSLALDDPFQDQHA